MSVSRDIRERAVAVLRAQGLTVDEWRLNPLQLSDSYPRVVVTTPSQQDIPNPGPTVHSLSKVDLVLDVFAAAADSNDDLARMNQVDTIEDLVLSALLADNDLLNMVERVQGVSIERGGSDMEGRRLGASSITISFEVRAFYDPDVAAEQYLDMVDILAKEGGDATPDIEREVDVTSA